MCVRLRNIELTDPYREGRKMIMRENSHFRDPQHTPPRPTRTKPSLPRPIGEVLQAVVGSDGRGMTVLVSNLGTQNRDFTVLIWVPELLPSRSEMVRFRAKVKVARDKGGRKWV